MAAVSAISTGTCTMADGRAPDIICFFTSDAEGVSPNREYPLYL